MSVLRLQFKLAFNQVHPFKMWIAGLGFAIFLSGSLFVVLFTSHYKNRFYQGVYVGNYHLGGLTLKEAEQLIVNQVTSDKKTPSIILQAVTQQEIMIEKQLEFSQLVGDLQFDQALQEAYLMGRTGNFFTRANDIIQLAQDDIKILPRRQIKKDNLQQAVEELAKNVNVEGKPPTVQLTQTGNPHSLTIFAGENGWKLPESMAVTQLLEELNVIVNSENNIQHYSEINLVAPTTLVRMKLDDQELEQLKNRTLSFVGSHIKLIPRLDQKAKEASVLLAQADRAISDQQIIDFLSIGNEDQKTLIEEFSHTIAQDIDQPFQNAEFEYNLDTLRAVVFKPHQPGLSLDQNELTLNLMAAIKEIEDNNKAATQETQNLDESNSQKIINLSIHQVEPELALSETNDLGINELIGFGESHYRGSIAPRVHNVKVASDKLNMALVPPGETFSFNKVVGKVDGSTGFQQAYVIRSGSTLMEFGGGVCQVSTTMFRAMLDAGVNIIKRLPHSYRVRYYELDNQPGFDATVYSGEVDLRFINDTPGYVLIIAEADSSTAYMSVKIYGTNDERHSEISGYRQWDYASPPPSQDIPDPSLASGQRKQVENAVPGIKTSFDWKVFNREGSVLHEKTFFSHYRAWGAKYLVGI